MREEWEEASVGQGEGALSNPLPPFLVVFLRVDYADIGNSCKQIWTLGGRWPLAAVCWSFAIFPFFFVFESWAQTFISKELLIQRSLIVPSREVD